MRRTRMSILAVCVAVVLSAVAPVPSPAAAAPIPTATYTFNLWHWNVGGGMMHAGSTTDGMVDVAVSSIQARKADFVSFNEICRSQYDAVQAKLSKAEWPQDDTNFSRFTVFGAKRAQCSGSDLGSAIFSKRALADAERYTLTADGEVDRVLTCVHPTDFQLSSLRFCNTHITTTPGIKDKQIDDVQRRLAAYEQDLVVPLVVGDFNVQPHYGQLNDWYSPELATANNGSNTGHYRELDDTDAGCPGYGEYTATGLPAGTPPCRAAQPLAKIDLMFVPENDLAGSYSADSLSIATTCTGIPATEDYVKGSCADHRIVIGTVSVAVPQMYPQPS